MKNPQLVNVPAIIIGAFVFILECILLFCYLTLLVNLQFLVAFHLLISLCLLLFALNALKKNRDARYPFLLFLATLGAGPFGVGSFLLQSLLYPLFLKFSPSPAEWFEGLFPVQSMAPFAEIFQRIQSGWDDYSQLFEIVSFKNIFTYGTLSQKQTVLDAIIKDYDPIYAPILLEALSDPHNTVRIQAAAMVSKIEHDFEEELMKIVSEKPNKQDFDFILRMAIFYDRYISLGILDPLMKKEMARQAVDFYQQYLSRFPEKKNIRMRMIRLLFLTEDYNAFIACSDELYKKYGNLPKIFQSQYLEALYKLHRPEELLAVQKEFRK